MQVEVKDKLINILKGARVMKGMQEKINRIPRERAQDLCVGNDNTVLVDAHPSDTYGRE